MPGTGRQLWVTIGANITGLTAGLAKAQANLRAFDQAVAQNARKRQAIDQLGSSFGKLGLAAAVGVGMSVKAAMDWETAWTGVTKTVNGSTAELAKLEDQLREMARTMPATHGEIAAVAEAAGQLGVATPAIADFTRIMIELGESTNLTADEAATSIAQLMNVMQTAPADVDNLGAAIVALGNNGASTERDIVQMAQNIAGAGKTVGLSETDVLGLANALSSVGIEAEAGGSAVSRILIDMAKAAKTGSKEMAVWQSVAEKGGLATGTFAKEMKDAPAEAFVAFTKGLGKINSEGGDVFTLLESLGQSDVRVTRALLGMANAGDLLSDSLELGASSFRENTALSKEYGKRVETAGSKARIAWNGIKDNLIDIGDDALPVVKDLSEAVSSLTGAFGDLPKPVKSSVLQMLAMTAALGGSVFVVSRAITGFSNLTNTLAGLSMKQEALTRRQTLMRGGMLAAGLALASFTDDAHKTNDGLGILADTASGALLGSAFGPWGAVIGGAGGALVGLLRKSDKTATGLDKNKEATYRYADSFDAVSNKATKATRALVATDLQKGGAFRLGAQLGIKADLLVDAAMNVKGAEKRLLKQVSKVSADQAGTAASLLQMLGIVGEEYDRSKAKAKEFNDAVNRTSPKLKVDNEASEQIAKVEKGLFGLDPVTSLLITGDADPGKRQAQALKAYIDAITGTVDISGNTQPGKGDTRGLLGYINRQTGIVDVGANTAPARAAVAAFKAGIGSVRLPILGRLSDVQEADGSILDFYADGGTRESHVAQIAPAGAWRVWAEPETGGEAYIPFAPSKRSRSRQIALEAVNRLGGVAAFADGGTSSRGGSTVTERYMPLDLSDSSIRRLGDYMLAASRNVSHAVVADNNFEQERRVLS